MDNLTKQHFQNASVNEQSYLKRDPTGELSREILKILTDSRLSVANLKGCLEYTAFILDFLAYLPTEK